MKSKGEQFSYSFGENGNPVTADYRDTGKLTYLLVQSPRFEMLFDGLGFQDTLAGGKTQKVVISGENKQIQS